MDIKLARIMKKIVFICAILGLGIGIYGLWRISRPNANLVKCYTDSDSSTWTELTPQDCGKLQYEQKIRDEKGKEIGCEQGDRIFCFGKNYRQFIWSKNDWVETDESSICSPYADKKVSDLPIKCLDYFGLKK